MLVFVDVVWEGFGGHFEGEVLDVLFAVVFVRLRDGVVCVDAVERGGVRQNWRIWAVVQARGSGIVGGAFAECFGHAAGVGGDRSDGALQGA